VCIMKTDADACWGCLRSLDELPAQDQLL